MGILECFSLEGKTAIVTGAGRGIGKSLAIGFAEAGANVCVPDIDSETSKKTARELAEIGSDSMSLKTDVTRKTDVAELVKKVEKKYGGIDILVNNAGIAIHEHAEKMTDRQWSDVMKLNLDAVFRVSREVGNVMLRQESGSIINIASMSGSIVNTPQPQAAYNTSKAGVIMLTKSLAAEWAASNIRVNSISPGYTRTEMAMMPDALKMHPTWKKMIPMKRMAEPEELRGAAVFLASDASSYMTGHDLVIDGGYTVL